MFPKRNSCPTGRCFVRFLKSTVLFSVSLILLLTQFASAENWVEFYNEKWSQKSGGGRKKLVYSNRYYYDGDSLLKKTSGDITLSVKEVSENDRTHVKKGAVESETLFRQVHLWCKLKRYEVLQSDTDGGEANESISEEIRSGTYYEKLYQAVCALN